MMQLGDIVNYCDELLVAHKYRDYAPNGLQVEGRSEVKNIVAGVTASQALIDEAVDSNADAVLVHHGFFWKNEAPQITGIKKNRIAALLKANISLIAYHLPLDGHKELGNNAQLAKVLGISIDSECWDAPEGDLLMYGNLNQAMKAKDFSAHIQKKLLRRPLHIGEAEKEIKTIAWCTGAAQSYIDKAAEKGVDAFMSGEISESTFHYANEMGIHYFAAGHHATERYGVKALAQHLEQKFDLNCRFVDIDNPV